MTYVPGQVLTAAELNSTVTALASASATAQALAAGDATAAAQAETDAQAAKSAAAAASTAAAAAAAAAATAQSAATAASGTATAAATQAAAAKAEADAVKAEADATKSEADANAAAITAQAALIAANTSAATAAQARADAAYALAQAAGSGAAPVRPALSAGTQVNVDAASRLVEHSGGALTMFPSAVTNEENIRGVVWPLQFQPPYTVTAKLRLSMPQANSFSGGLLSSTSASTKLVLFGPGFSSSAKVHVTQWNSAQSSPGTFDNFSGEYPQPWVYGGEVYLREYDDGTTHTYQHSRDGIDWITLESEAESSFLTRTAIGFGCRSNSYGNSAPNGGTVALISLVQVQGIPAS